ncbi:MAG: hypothetical protein HZC28_04025 [Spirochaetes bacterium]|nr:hypothetical protein [Spirochaetota bacterium]
MGNAQWLFFFIVVFVIIAIVSLIITRGKIIRLVKWPAAGISAAVLSLILTAFERFASRVSTPGGAVIAADTWLWDYHGTHLKLIGNIPIENVLIVYPASIISAIIIFECFRFFWKGPSLACMIAVTNLFLFVLLMIVEYLSCVYFRLYELNFSRMLLPNIPFHGIAGEEIIYYIGCNLFSIASYAVLMPEPQRNEQ